LDGSWTENVLYSFCSGTNCVDGSTSYANLIFDSAGNLYGTTPFGGSGSGVVFQLVPNADGSWTESVLHNFCSRMRPFCADGYQPAKAMIFDVAGNLYGTTFGGGARNSGVVFKLTPNPKSGWKESVLHSFLNAPGGAPDAGLIFGPTGKAYGTTQGDNHKIFGLVF
jgi:uncharacterized repeat protein (TIGR03803 family)